MCTDLFKTHLPHLGYLAWSKGGTVWEEGRKKETLTAASIHTAAKSLPVFGQLC